MAKTLASIRIDFDKAMRMADELDDLASNLTTLAENQMNGTLQEIRRTWTGEASGQYLKKGQILEEKISKSAEQLKKISEAVRITARVTYQAEQEALRLAQIREY